jgi:hypothetical protein
MAVDWGAQNLLDWVSSIAVDWGVKNHPTLT